jgi:hypothetical protein
MDQVGGASIFLGPSMAQKERKRDAFFFNYFSTLTAMAVNKA